jgi:Sulfatase-modifying factor enzyme 1
MPYRARSWIQWWSYVPGADWRHPRGPNSDLAGLGDHPVVHVAWQDVAETYKAAPRAMPNLVPTTPEDPATAANRAAWQRLSAWDKPFLVAFSDRDPITSAMGPILHRLVPGAERVTITGGGRFLQEDCGERLATAIARFTAPVTRPVNGRADKRWWDQHRPADLDQIAIDGSITKAPGGVKQAAHRSTKVKYGMKRPGIARKPRHPAGTGTGRGRPLAADRPGGIRTQCAPATGEHGHPRLLDQPVSVLNKQLVGRVGVAL